MKRLVLTGLAVAAIGAASPAVGARAHPALRLARGTDALVVYGTGFYANERVRVTVVATSQNAQVVRTRAAERAPARDRAADEGIPPASDLARIGQSLGERHADPRSDRRREPRVERVVRPVSGECDGEDRRQRRQRAVDETDHRRLHALK